MTEAEVLDYVKAVARALAVPLDEQRAQAVALHLGRTAEMARLVAAAPLAPEVELAEIFRPAPFPPEEDAA